MCRHSYVIAVGGGAVLDMVGFAAATAHRGIPLVRVPTTSLSQADGGMGVKNGREFLREENWLGSFGVPHAIVNDAMFLHALPVRERRAGLIEAVKVALIRDAAFFDFIAARVEALAKFEPVPFEAVIRESARQHIEHIATAGDPFERGSARPLGFRTLGGAQVGADVGFSCQSRRIGRDWHGARSDLRAPKRLAARADRRTNSRDLAAARVRVVHAGAGGARRGRAPEGWFTGWTNFANTSVDA